MSSLYLNKLSREQREGLVATLLSSQNGNCFVCGKTLDLAVHGNSADIDHIEPIKVGGKDGPENFAVTHDSCNRMKKASDLRVARILASFDQIAESISEENRAPNLGGNRESSRKSAERMGQSGISGLLGLLGVRRPQHQGRFETGASGRRLGGVEHQGFGAKQEPQPPTTA